MWLLVQLPDAAATAVQDMLAWRENRRYLSDGEVMTVTNGSDTERRYLGRIISINVQAGQEPS